MPTISNIFSVKIYVKEALSPYTPGIRFEGQPKPELGFNTAEIQKENLGLKIPLLLCCILDYGIATFHQIEKGNWEAHRIKFQMLCLMINISYPSYQTMVILITYNLLRYF